MKKNCSKKKTKEKTNSTKTVLYCVSYCTLTI